uniref:Putative LOC100995896 [Pan paniscus] n=1 Tax=Lepeophtheirus salmonis TaxID=72036 RepID=A0A0K2UND6_LEPSM
MTLRTSFPKSLTTFSSTSHLRTRRIKRTIH